MATQIVGDKLDAGPGISGHRPEPCSLQPQTTLPWHAWPLLPGPGFPGRFPGVEVKMHHSAVSPGPLYCDPGGAGTWEAVCCDHEPATRLQRGGTRSLGPAGCARHVDAARRSDALVSSSVNLAKSVSLSEPSPSSGRRAVRRQVSWDCCEGPVGRVGSAGQAHGLVPLRVLCSQSGLSARGPEDPGPWRPLPSPSPQGASDPVRPGLCRRRTR